MQQKSFRITLKSHSKTYNIRGCVVLAHVLDSFPHVYTSIHSFIYVYVLYIQVYKKSPFLSRFTSLNIQNKKINNCVYIIYSQIVIPIIPFYNQFIQAVKNQNRHATFSILYMYAYNMCVHTSDRKLLQKVNSPL